MAATWTLAGPTIQQTSQANLIQAPFVGSQVLPAIATATISAGTAAALTLTAGQMRQYPVINLICAAANANHTIVIPVATAVPAGTKVRFTRGDAVVARTFNIGVTGGAANGMYGCIIENSVTAPIAAANVSVGFTATAVIGDWIEFFSTGVVWEVMAVSSVAAGIAAA